MTAAEFEQKWTSSPNGRLANRPERFNVARVAHALRDRLNEGRDPEEARARVMREPYYRADLASAFDPLDGGGELLEDFNSIDAAA
jgi:hypothetical protein